MATERYRQTYSWQQAIGFGRWLSRLTEELPKTETELVRQLQSLEIDLPAAVGRDLRKGTSARLDELVRLHAVVDLVELVYAALDLNQLQAEVQKLEQQLTSPNFELEIKEAPQPPAVPAPAPAQQEPPASV